MIELYRITSFSKSFDVVVINERVKISSNGFINWSVKKLQLAVDQMDCGKMELILSPTLEV